MIDPHSATWRAIEKRAAAAIEEYRASLEAQGLPLAETEHLRGRIAAWREILNLGTPQPELSGSGVVA